VGGLEGARSLSLTALLAVVLSLGIYNRYFFLLCVELMPNSKATHFPGDWKIVPLHRYWSLLNNGVYNAIFGISDIILKTRRLVFK